MADIVKQDVINFAAELATVSDAVWTDLLAYVNTFNLSQVADEIDERMARIFLAAHMAAENKKSASGSVGPVTAESAGNVRRSYGLVAMSSSASLESTRYGRQYLAILGRSLAGCPMVI